MYHAPIIFMGSSSWIQTLPAPIIFMGGRCGIQTLHQLSSWVAPVGSKPCTHYFHGWKMWDPNPAPIIFMGGSSGIQIWHRLSMGGSSGIQTLHPLFTWVADRASNGTREKTNPALIIFMGVSSVI